VGSIAEKNVTFNQYKLTRRFHEKSVFIPIFHEISKTTGNKY